MEEKPKGPESEWHNLDPFKNVLPDEMFWKKGYYYVRAQRGGQRRKHATGKQDFKAAMRRYHEIMKAWNDGESGWDAPSTPTLAAYWKDYRAAFTVRKSPRSGTTDTWNDDLNIRVVLADLGTKRLDEFTPTVCQKWTNRRRKMDTIHGTRVSEGTVTKEIALIQAIFNQAIQDGHLEKNPWKRVEREGYAVRERVLTESEQGRLLAAFEPGIIVRKDGKPTGYAGNAEVKRFILFLLGTGLRLEETLTLREGDDINLAERWVRVTRKTRGLKKKIQKVPLIDPALVGILKEQLATGQLWHKTPVFYRSTIATACRRAGVEPVSPHTLRHTFATRYLKSGGDIYVLSKLLGHANVAVTEKVYAHLVSEDLLARSAGIKLGLTPAEPAKVLEFKK